MKSIVANVAEAIGVILFVTFAGLFALACLCADDYSAPDVPAAMQGWEAR